MKNILSVFILIFLFNSINAQNDNSIIAPQEPSVAALETFGKYPVNLSTGLTSISIPIYTIKSGDIELPITLNYHASGIRVNQEASWVGLGWALDYGGQITRQVNGKVGLSASEVPDANEIADELHNKTMLNISSKYDTYIEEDKYQPDIYSYQLNGYSGEFTLFYDSQSDQKEVLLLQHSGVQIKNKNFDWRGTDYSVKLPNGISYSFVEGDQVTSDKYADLDTYCQNYVISRVYSPNTNKSLIFSYEAEGSYRNNNILNQKRILEYGYKDCELYNCNPSYYNSLHSTTNIRPLTVTSTKKIKKIEFENGRVLFEFGTRNDLKPVTIYEKFYRLDNIIIERLNSNGSYTEIERYKFNYGYFNEEVTSTNIRLLRLKLNSVQKITKAGAYLLGQFYYYDGLPDKNTFAQDWWGYYNGVTSNVDLMPEKMTTPWGKTAEVKIGTANRDPNIKYTKAGTLYEIKLPTGGTTSFEYEANSVYSENRTEKTSNQLNLDGCGNPRVDYTTLPPPSPKEEGQCIWPKYQYFSFKAAKNEKIEVRYIIEYLGGDIQSDKYGFATLKINGELIDGIYGSVSNTKDEKTIYLNIKKGENISFELSTYGENFNVKSVYLKYSSPLPPGNETAGGLRIKSITNKDKEGIFLNKKRYYYNLLDNREKSSGYFLSANRFSIDSKDYRRIWHKHCSPKHLLLTCENSMMTTTFFANSLYGPKASSVAYQYVSEVSLDINDNPNGVSEYEFIYQKESTSGYNRPFASKGWIRSKLLKETIKAGNDLDDMTNVSETSYEYIFDERINSHSRGFFIEKLGEIDGYEQSANYNADAFYLPVNYLFSSIWLYNSAKTTRNFNSSGEVVNKEYYEYDHPEYAQLDRSYSINSEGKQFSVEYTYPYEIDTDIYNTLKNNNRISQPVEIIKKVNGDVTQSKMINYQYFNNKIFPASIYKLNTTRPLVDYFPFDGTTSDSRYDDVEVEFLDYDNNGNVLSVRNKKDQINCYLWGYKNAYPIAKIENANYSQVNLVVDTVLIHTLSNADNDHGKRGSGTNEDALRSALDLLYGIKGAIVTTYTYDPLIGMTSATDPNGRTTYYEYDDLGRLYLIRDQDGNIIKKYEYKYATEKTK